MADRISKFKIKDIQPNPHNLRADLTDIEGLARSIAFVGLIEPIRVDKDGKVLAGHRRREALDWLVDSKDFPEFTADTEMPCIVGNKVTEGDETAIMLVENMQRVDLDIQEQVEGVRRLMADHGWTQAQVAEQLGVTKKWVTDRINIQGVPLEAFDRDRPFTVEALSQFGQLPEKVKDKLAAKGKDISQYDIEDRFSKMKSEEKMERELRKLQKDGYLATTEAEIKRLMKHDGTGLDARDQMIKTAIGNATTTSSYAYVAVDEPTLVFLHHFGDLMDEVKAGNLDKNDLIVAVKSGGFWRWHTTEVKQPKKEKSESKRDWEIERDKRVALERANKEAALVGMHKYVEDTKPAEIIVDVLWDVIRRTFAGYNSYRTSISVLKALGLEPLLAVYPEDEDDWDGRRDAETTAAHENVEQITLHARRNKTTLAGTAAVCRMVAVDPEELIENWDVTVEIIEDIEIETPLEAGV